MIIWEEVLVREQYREEALEEAQRQRLIRQVSRRGTASYQLVLGRLGEQLVKWGCRLQAKYGTLTEATNSVCYVKTLRQKFLVAGTSARLSSCSDKR